MSPDSNPTLEWTCEIRETEPLAAQCFGGVLKLGPVTLQVRGWGMSGSKPGDLYLVIVTPCCAMPLDWVPGLEELFPPCVCGHRYPSGPINLAWVFDLDLHSLDDRRVFTRLLEAWTEAQYDVLTMTLMASMVEDLPSLVPPFPPRGVLELVEELGSTGIVD